MYTVVISGTVPPIFVILEKPKHFIPNKLAEIEPIIKQFGISMSCTVKRIGKNPIIFLNEY